MSIKKHFPISRHERQSPAHLLQQLISDVGTPFIDACISNPAHLHFQRDHYSVLGKLCSLTQHRADIVCTDDVLQRLYESCTSNLIQLFPTQLPRQDLCHDTEHVSLCWRFCTVAEYLLVTRSAKKLKTPIL